LDERTYSKYFKAFGDVSRLRILGLLASKEMTVNDIARSVDLNQSTVSRHLGVLREANIVIDHRDGQQVFYSLNKSAIESCCNGFCDCLEVDDKRAERKKS